MSTRRELPRDGADPQVPAGLPPHDADRGGTPPSPATPSARDAPAFEAPPPPPSWPMMRAMVGIGLACGLLIVTVFQGTAPVIAANRAELLQRAIFEVLPEATSSKSYALAGGDRFEPMGEGESTLDADARVVHAGYDDEQRLVGFALEASAMGYADLITLLYGYDHREQQVVGMVVLQSKETPGLGDRIETEPDFVANFAALDVSLDDSGAAKQNPIAAVKQGTKQHPWEVDGITGATISSKAVVAALERSTSFWAPRLRARLADFVAEDSP